MFSRSTGLSCRGCPVRARNALATIHGRSPPPVGHRYRKGERCVPRGGDAESVEEVGRRQHAEHAGFGWLDSLEASPEDGREVGEGPVAAGPGFPIAETEEEIRLRGMLRLGLEANGQPSRVRKMQRL